MNYQFRYSKNITITIEIDTDPKGKMPFSYRLTDAHKDKRPKNSGNFDKWVRRKMIQVRDQHAKMLTKEKQK